MNLPPSSTIPLSSRHGLRGYILALLLALLLFALGSKGFADLGLGWKALGVPPLAPGYADLDSGCAAARFAASGHDPYTDPSFNPQGHPTNYSVWLLTLMGAWCGLWTSSQAGGLALVGLTVLLFGILARRLPFLGGAMLGLGLTLGSPTLGLERGNSDLLLLPLVALTVLLPIWLRRREDGWAAPASFALLLLAAVILKLFPVFALPAALALPDKQMRLRALAMALAAIAAYVVIDFHTLSLLLGNTPSSPLNSYGIPAALLFLKPGSALALPARTGATALALGAGFYLYKKQPALAPPAQMPGWAYALCLAGAGIFAVTYLASASYGYRLVFVLLCLPYLALVNTRQAKLLACALVLFTAWPFVESSARLILPWVPPVKAAFFLARQALGLALLSVALGWLLRQAVERLARSSASSQSETA